MDRQTRAIYPRRMTNTKWLAALLCPAPAFAHAILTDSTPAPEAHIPHAATIARLRYNSRIDAGRSRLTLVQPDHTTAALPILPGPQPNLLSADLDLAPGDYVIKWQVLATDGHITRGRLPFTVDAR